jgi:hypothetical protein
MESRSVYPMLFQESPARSSIVVGDPSELCAQLGRVSLFPNDFKCLRWPHQRFPIPSHSPYLNLPYTQLGPKKKREIATFPATFFLAPTDIRHFPAAFGTFTDNFFCLVTPQCFTTVTISAPAVRGEHEHARTDCFANRFSSCPAGRTPYHAHAR